MVINKNKMMMNKKYLGLLVIGSINFAFGLTTASILPTGAGSYSAWTPSTGTTHYTLVDESACNGLTDYVSTNVANNRDSYAVSLANVPDGSTITGVSITPCASKSTSNKVANMKVFYKLNGVNSTDSSVYYLSGTTPVNLTPSNYYGLSVVKVPSTTLEVGAVLVTGATTGARLSRMATMINYTAPSVPPIAPSNLNTTVSSSTNVFLSWLDNSSNETGFWLERGTDGINFNLLATTTSSNYFNVGLSTGTYYYRVRAYNSYGSSAFSSTTIAVIQ
ncbi:MAG: fibronectin type III domain-containing protein [Candidatus Pacebacteria bacterium]|nr:fibronectin type III domain-containing protein [Candidatus Paceibacterota bacterium]MBP9866927.1 fibronectin type III domain-containing protein [Candidatus Paceibacterota bacterium]